MASIDIPIAGSRAKGVRRSKKLSTRVDLTPMVDLGFLLITFFIFTTNLSEARSAKLVLPADGASSNLGESAALTVIPTHGDSIFYYNGSWSTHLPKGSSGWTSSNAIDGIGQIIRQKQKALDVSGLGRKEMMLLIKPADASSYTQFIRLLDEVMIEDIKHYALMDLSAEERAYLTERKITVE
ncbi:MAG TPA: biopolymer transporter ExbD [Chitinophagaceae bacterium]|nr:biopolymer transporter ExbD [Chitinophagaceae bacterium]